jgi:hypothetical protein
MTWGTRCNQVRVLGSVTHIVSTRTRRRTAGTHHRAVGDESDESVRGQQTQADDDRLPECLEVILVQTGVDDVEEDGRDLGGASEGVLDCGVLGEELGGEVVARDVLVVRREGVALEAEGADPELPPHVNLTVRVQNRAAGCFARHGLVQDGRELPSSGVSIENEGR